MTAHRDPDRIVRAWLDLMPHEAPDRAIAAVLQAVEAAPQVRRPLVRGPRRFPAMNRFVLIAAVAVLGAALFGGALLVGGGRNASPAPTPAMSATLASPVATAPPSSAVVTGAALPASLQYRWIGEPRDIPGHGTSTRTGLNFLASSFFVTGTEYGFGASLLNSTASDIGSGRLRLETATAAPDCAVGDVGTYAWSLSPGGTVLTVEPGTDACTARAAALPGTWYRIACTNTADGCIGELEAGTYPSQYIAPRLDIGASWAPDLGALTYTVPAGWANSSDWPNTFSLTPAADYRLEDASGPPDRNYHEIFLFTQPLAARQDAACSDTPDPTIDRSAAGLLAWLGTLPSLSLSKALPVTIDGHRGTMVDIGLKASWKTSCPGDAVPSAAYFTQAGDRQNAYGVGIFAGERQRLILLDLGGGDVLGIQIDSVDPSRFDELATAAMPIIESFHIR
jgi:hypothetical protein